MNQTMRKRSKNFTPEEEVLLVELVEKHKHVIENKKSDAVIWKKKKDAWKTIEKDFETTTGTHRHYQALRDKYDLLKRKSRLEMAEKKFETYLTGDGNSTRKISNISTKVAAMLADSATRLQNCIDSDSLIDENFVDCVIENAGDQKTNEENKQPESELSAKRKKNLEEEKMKLIKLQQQFFKDENIRAQENHEQELLSLKLKNEILQLELEEKRIKIKCVKETAHNFVEFNKLC